MSIGVATQVTGDATPSVRTGRARGVHLNQIVVSQVAVVLVLIGALRGGSVLLVTSGCAVGLLALTWGRARGRWAFGWLGALARFALRGRSARIDSPVALLRYAAPRTVVTTADLAGMPIAVLADELGMTVLVELGDPSAEMPPLPPLVTLLPVPDRDQPPTRVQLVLTGVPAPPGRAGARPAANSYRELCEGSSLGHIRAVLAITMLRTGGWTDEELRRGLLGLGRRLTRKPGNPPVRILDPTEALTVISEIAHAGDTGEAWERWSDLRLGGLVQATFRCHPRADGSLPGHLIARLLRLPSAATTVAMTSELPSGRTTSLALRLAAADPAGLSTAVDALRRLLAAEGATLRRWDGAHLSGLVATLPVGSRPADEDSFDGPGVPALPAGLTVGRNRQGLPVRIRLFRPEPTMALLVGGLPAAQLVTFRAMAAGARVVVRSTRPQAWEPFVRGAATPGESIRVMPPDRLDIPVGSPLRPTLIIVDTGPAGATHPLTGSPLVVAAGTPDDADTSGSRDDRWQTTLMVRDTVEPADLDPATAADVLVLQTLDPAEAALLGEALSLGDTATYLTRMRPDMVAVVDRRAVRWATLAQTQIEAALIGDPRRSTTTF